MARTVEPTKSHANEAPHNAGMFSQKRSRIVWALLIGSMTTVTALLMALDTNTRHRLDGRALPALVVTTGSTSLEAIFNTRKPVQPGQWRAIVIDCSGSPYGTPETIDAQHRATGRRGLGSDFVIGNGNGMGAGEIHVGYRWLEQQAGAHTAGPQGEWYNRHAIGIMLVGDGTRQRYNSVQMSRLFDLVAALAREYKIPSDKIVLHSDVAPVEGPGRFFPAATFREQVDSWDD